MTEKQMIVQGKKVRFIEEDDDAKIVVDSWEQIPRFANDEQAAGWWDTHDLSEDLWRDAIRRGQETVTTEMLPPVRQGIHQHQD